MGVLGIDACLDGVPVGSEVLLGQRQWLPQRHPQLPVDQVESGDQLGDGMLDLEPGVHLQEGHGPRGLVDEELHRARADIADLAGEGHSCRR